MTTSVVDPWLDRKVNASRTFNVLEGAWGSSSMPAVVFSSTNKVYGAMEDVPARRNVEFLVKDCRDNHQDNFDGVVIADVLHHTPYAEQIKISCGRP